MELRQGIVVGRHPEDHSVDLVMVDDGSRHVGVAVLTPNGSGTSGLFDMPPVPDRGADKWDIKTPVMGEQIALVGFMRKIPVVVGFMFPKGGQMTFNDGKRMVYRHQSDLTVSIEETGALHIRHPGGLSLSIGTPDNPRDGTNQSSAGNFAVTKNKTQRLDVSLSFPGFALKADKDGLTISAKKIDLKAASIKLNSKKVSTAGGLQTGGDVKAGGVVIPNAGKMMS